MTVYEWNGHLKIFSNRKLQAIFASPNRYFTENSRSVPLPKLYDIFFQAQPVFLHRKGEGSLLLSEFECPRAILIKQQQQQQQHHIFFIMNVPLPPPPPPHPTTRILINSTYLIASIITFSKVILHCDSYFQLCPEHVDFLLTNTPVLASFPFDGYILSCDQNF